MGGQKGAQDLLGKGLHLAGLRRAGQFDDLGVGSKAGAPVRLVKGLASSRYGKRVVHAVREAGLEVGPGIRMDRTIALR